jgi:peptidoglycan/LPS O-acetylase OafA/YrhL
MPPTKPYFTALTGLRAVGAWSVFFYHINPFGTDSTAWKIAHEGHVGVTLFFVLSGFLICVGNLEGVQLSANWFRTYLGNRVARIVPLYMLLTVLTFVLYQLNNSFDPSGLWKFTFWRDKLLIIVLNLTFLRGFFKDFIFSGIAQGWTLTVEILYYLAFPLLLLGLRRTRWPAALLLGYGALFVAVGCLLVLVLPHRFGLFQSPSFLFSLTFFGRASEFLIGMGLALLVRRASPIHRPRAPLFTYGGLAWIAACISGLIFLNDPLDEVTGALPRPEELVLNNLVLPFGVAALLWGLIYERSRVRWLLKSRVFKLLGGASYAFYLVHIGVANQFLLNYLTQSVWLRFVLLNSIAIVLFHYVEEPLNKMLRPARQAA